MKAKQLKNSILQYAMHGKLVPQNPNDESASILLERINEKKELLIKEKLIRDVKVVKHSKWDEFIYSIPESWVWVPFGQITYNRDAERIPLSVKEREKHEKVYDYYGASGVIDKVNNYLFDKPLLLIGEDGANLISRSTPIAFIAKGKYWVNNHAHVIDGIDLIFLQFLEMYINSISLYDFITGTAQPKMNQTMLNSIPVPLPPVEEQKRIVEKIEELFKKVDEYDVLEQEISTINKTFPADMEKSILQHAMQGKLVEQDPNDEPASVLLDRIKEEKEQLIKDKVIKREKALASITDDEIPFEIPNSWEWTRLGDLFIKNIGGGTPSKANSKYWNGEIPWASVKDLNGNDLSITMDSITPLGLENSSANLVEKDNVIVCTRMGLGKIVINKIDIAINQDLRALYFLNKITNKYFLYFFHTVKFIGKGATVKGISTQELNSLLVPLPPLNEQKRIVEKIEEMLKVTNKLKNSINISIN